MLSKLFSKDYFQDRLLLVLTGLASLSAIGIIFRVLITVEQYDFKIATSYTQYGADSFGLGDWYTLYQLPALAFISTVATIIISARLHRQDKGLSYTVVVLQLVILFFLFFVTNALLSVSSVVS